MTLPKEISPSPIVMSVVELRFKEARTENLLTSYYKLFSNDLPQLEKRNVPKIPDNLASLPIEVRNQIKYLADTVLSNDEYKLLFGRQSLMFEHVGGYTLWSNYSSFIFMVLDKLAESSLLGEVERIGVRYGSILGSPGGTHDVLRNVPQSITVEGYNSRLEKAIEIFEKNHVQLLLNISSNAIGQNSDGKLSGVYIDIDASCVSNLSSLKSIKERIIELHDEEKKLFFSLLKEDYIKTLNPKY